MRPLYYILEDRKPVQIQASDRDAIMEWARWMEFNDRTVAKSELPDGSLVSTVFLGLDHSFKVGGDPILFETMAFGPKGAAISGMQRRYCTWEEAERGHQDVLEELKNSRP